MLSSLLRLLEAESGQIVIDGIVSSVSFLALLHHEYTLSLVSISERVANIDVHDIIIPRTSPRLACVS